MRIILVRHCEVDVAYHKRYNGHIDIGLSRRGKEQAKALAKRFEDEKFDLVYCSDLLRAKETLKPFKQAKEAIYTDKLREKSWGKHEGKSFDEIMAEGEIVYEHFEQWIDALDGEPYEAYIKRVKEFFLEYLASHKAENILVITHAGVIRVLIAIVQKLSLEEAFCIDVSYSSYIVFDTKEQTFSTIK
ncbi:MULTISPECIES: alpha-ribazole phosphatase family protein [Sulfurimonas]|uniref:histidine phosphatase family protein n=1 Tax=Sulfurimonas TaxID=202746 RepID=UPI001264088C|nr:alpha-ribazole phosphatase family protein [Sulfurimonas indica]